MPSLRWLSALLLALAIVAGAAFWLQRQSGAQLREEAALLRDEHRQLDQLRAENLKLVAAQPPAAELDRLRADHAAVGRLRAEIERLKAGLGERERRLMLPPPDKIATTEAGQVPAAQILSAEKLRNAGTATPLAALETMLWAGRSGNVDALSSMMLFDVRATAQAQAMFDALPDAAQKTYGTPFRLIAALMAKDMPAGDASVTTVGANDPAAVSVKLDAEFRTANDSGAAAHLEFKKINDHWSVWIPQRVIEPLATTSASLPSH